MNERDRVEPLPASSSDRRLSIRSTSHRVQTPDEGLVARSPERQKSVRFDVANTMDRLRQTIAGINPESIPLDDTQPTSWVQHFSNASSQIPAILLIAMFHLLIGIPFGVSYFPVSWGDDHEFPISGKDALGIRMFLFSTMFGQLFFTKMSGFTSPIGLQMVENVPFCHSLAQIVFQHQGYGMDSLSTLFVMFGISSLVVGAVFLILGKLKLGRIVYYFPAHVLVGCIGGIGLYISKTGVEVTTNQTFGLESIVQHIHLLIPVACFEIFLRILERWNVNSGGKVIFPLLFPIYFCLVSPTFYIALLLLRVSIEEARENGFFFPSLVDGGCGSARCSFAETILTPQLFDMWTVIDLSAVSWSAIADSIPTLIALTLFSLIHVPINIPAFSLSSGIDVDMNEELVAHGYSNITVGIFAGLQNYMAYTQSVLYDKSGGRGKASGFLVSAATGVLFFVGPSIASYIPRCMAGSLLLHVGVDLFLEGVYDSIGKFDNVEYFSIWLITVIMTISGMEAAMLAGAISAVATHAVQSAHYVDPIRGSMTATTLRSSHWNRGNRAQAILDDNGVGRGRVYVIQLQGHLFFGNTARLTERLNEIIGQLQTTHAPWILIVDFSLVLGIDSSAAQTLVKLMSAIRKRFSVHTVIWVTGSDDGFPTDYELMRALDEKNIHNGKQVGERTGLISPNLRWENYEGNHVEESLDEALLYAEDALLHYASMSIEPRKPTITSDNEQEIACLYLNRIVPERKNGSSQLDVVKTLFSRFVREEFSKGECVWVQDSPSDTMKLLVRGELVAILENEAGTVESISEGNTIGELGLVQGLPRMSSVYCESEKAITYSLSRQAFEELCVSSPQAARLVDMICIRYLSARVQVNGLRACVLSI